MTETTTRERLIQIMNERGLRQKDIAELAQPYCRMLNERLGVSDISAYVTGKYQPAQKKLKLLALALNVSEAWLMGLPDAHMESQDSSLTSDEWYLLHIFRSLNEAGKRSLIKQAELHARDDEFTHSENSSAQDA